jgi:hypothetical protein
MKLKPKQYGPFKVIREISPVAYQLRLPTAWGIHDIFHASLLLPYHETTAHGPNFSRPPPELIDGKEEYQVECVMGHRKIGRTKKLQYLVKWLGYPDSDNTWEPVSQVHAPDLIKQYQHQHCLSIKTLQAMIGARCAPSLEQSQSNQSLSQQAPPPSKLSPFNSSPISNLDSSSSCGPTINLPTTPSFTLGSAKTTPAPTITPTDHKRCPPSLSILWLKHPLALRPPYGPP